MKKRLIVNALIVVGALALLALPYLLPDRSNYRGASTRVLCTGFTVRWGEDGAGRWIVSLTASNSGPRGAELTSGEFVGRFAGGEERWTVNLPRTILWPKMTTTMTADLFSTSSANTGPSVWEFHGKYQARDRKLMEWLKACQERLPTSLQVVHLPEAFTGTLVGWYPENYASILTNQLGWHAGEWRRYPGGTTNRTWHRDAPRRPPLSPHQ